MDYTPPPGSSEPTVMQAPAVAAAPRIPSAVSFCVAVLLFFMPFVDIKCNNMSLQTVSGIQLATGFKMKNSSSDNAFLNDVKPDRVDENITKGTTKSDKRNPNLFALVALALGVIGTGLAFTNSRPAVSVAMAAALGAAASLAGMFIDLKQNVKSSVPAGSGGQNGMEEFGRSLSESIKVTIDFTPWFYAAVLAFLAAAFFSFRRLKTLR